MRKSNRFLILFTLFLINSPAFGQWKWVHPGPQGNTIHKLVFAGTSNGWAAGENGTLIRTTNGGTSWSPLFSGSFENLLELDFADSLNGILCSGPDILVTNDGGRSWDLTYRFPGFTIDALKVLNTDTAFVGISNGIGKLYWTSDGGQTWSELLGNLPGAILDIDMRPAGNGILSGTGGMVMKTVNYGQTWTAVTMNTTDDLFDASMPTNQNIFIASSSEIHISGNGGTSFSATPNPGGTLGSDLLSIDFGNASNGVAGCRNGYVFHTTNGGTSWNQNFTDSWVDVHAVDAASSTTFFAAGSGGALYKSSNTGTSWNNLGTRIADLPLYAVDAFNSTVVYTCGAGGTILKSTNGGAGWVAQNSNAGGEDLRGIRFSSSTTGLAVGTNGTIVRTTDGGTTWNFIFSNIGESLYGVDRNSAGNWYVCGDDAKLATSPNGNIWTDLPTGFTGSGYNFRLIQCFGTDTLVISTDQPYLLTSFDAGATWNLVGNGSSFESTSMHFRNSNVGYIGTSIGEVYQTTDGGQTWNLLYQTLSSGPVDCIAFSDNNNGWFTTLNETYRTADGGQTWGREINFNKDPVYAIDFTSGTQAIGVGEGVASIFQRSRDLSFTVPATTFCTDNNYTLNIVANGTWNSGNTFRLELSDDFGEFGFPFLLGSIASTTSTPLTVSIPNGLTDGTDYRLRVLSTDPPCWSTLNSIPQEIRTSPDAIITPGGPTAFCIGSSVMLYAFNGGNWSFQWLLNGTPIQGATTDSLFVTQAGDYTLEVNDGSCATISPITDVITFNCTGLSENAKASDFILAPNPADRLIRLQNLSGQSISHYEIRDLSGKLIETTQVQSIQTSVEIEISQLAKGVYILMVHGEKPSALRFVKR